MNSGEELSVRQALGEIGRVDREVRRSARRGARWFLVLGVAVAIFWSLMHFAAGPLTTAATVGWLIFSVGAVRYACRSRVHDRVTYRMQLPLNGIFLVATVFNVWVLDYVRAGGGVWPVLVGIGGIVFSALPALYGARRALAALDDDRGPVSAP